MSSPNMLKVWLYELGWISSFGISLTVVNQALQTVLIIIGIISALLALKQQFKKQK